jgi:hypothetical protein
VLALFVKFNRIYIRRLGKPAEHKAGKAVYKIGFGFMCAVFHKEWFYQFL